MTQSVEPCRRGLLVAGAAGLLGLALAPKPAGAADGGMRPETRAAMDKVLRGRAPREGRIALRLPNVAENGAAVPLAVQVESPMTEADHVTAVHVFSERNPLPEVVGFRMTPAMGRAAAETRIRLAETQEVTALAEMSDGSVWIARAEVKVTLGGCVG